MAPCPPGPIAHSNREKADPTGGNDGELGRNNAATVETPPRRLCSRALSRKPVKLPADSLIPTEKLTRYLLVPQARADKSAFLARAGYTPQNPSALLLDLRLQILPLDAASTESNQFGEYFEIRGALRGPNGVMLRVKTIWIRDALSNRVRFVTLLPDKTRLS